MKIQRLLAGALAAILLLTAAGAVDGDPVITQSYLEKTYLPQLKSEATAILSSELAESSEKAFRSLAETAAEKNLSAAKTQWAAGKSVSGRLTLKKGDALSPLCGCKLTVSFGNLNTDAALIDVTSGAEATGNLTEKHLYMQQSETPPKLTVTSETAELTVNGSLCIALADGTDYGSLADALAEMGLFRGRTLGYDLDSGATRAEGLTMFLRLLGREKEALACTAEIPFVDVPKTHWAYPYVAYAYSLGLTNGTSETAFSPDSPVTAQHYLTFLMRALHYAEGTDFAWGTVLSDAVTKGLFSDAELAALNGGKFLRSRMVYMSYYALFCTDQESRSLLCDELIGRQVLTVDTLCAGIMHAKGGRIA